jgi:uncharacterized membrane protein YciS (DUF1049 family)
MITTTAILFALGFSLGTSITSLFLVIDTRFKLMDLINDEMTGTEYPTYEK